MSGPAHKIKYGEFPPVIVVFIWPSFVNPSVGKQLKFVIIALDLNGAVTSTAREKGVPTQPPLVGVIS